MSSPRLTVAVFTLALLGGLFVAPAPMTRATPGAFVADAIVPVTSSLGVGITFDGSTFYYTNYHDPTLYGFTLACVGSTCTSTLTAASPIRDATTLAAVNIDGLAFDSGRGVIWAAADANNNVYRIDPATGLATFAFAVSACGNAYGIVDGLAYDGINDRILYSPDVAYTACEFAPDGTLVNSIPISSISGFPGCYNSGLAIGGNVLYMGSDGCGQIVAVDRTTLASLGVFASPGGRDEGMTCDQVTFGSTSVIWSKDAYNNHLTAFEIQAGTCASGGGRTCSTPFTAILDDPQTGFDYVGATKTAQNPLLPAPRVSGVVTLNAHASPSGIATTATFYVDGVAIGTSGVPFTASWDSTTVAPGPHSVTARLSDGAACRASATQAIESTCGVPLVNAITRPVAGNTYANDIAYAGSPGAPVLLSDVTVTASSSDATRIANVDWTIDGTTFATGIVGSPWSATLPTSGLAIGLHTLVARLHETDARCTDQVALAVRVTHIVTEATAQGVYVATAQPEELIFHTVSADGPSTHRYVADNTVAAIGLRTQAVVDDGVSNANRGHASSQIADVSLLSGLVQVKLLRSEASVTLDPATLGMASSNAGTQVVGVIVNGIPVTVSQPNTAIPLPGGQLLVLDEETLTTSPGHAELRINALHLYTNVNGIRTETILGQAVAGVDYIQTPFEGRVRLIAPQDDAQIGGDASDSRTAPTMITVGNAGSDFGTVVFGARVGGSDSEDDYGVQVAQGEKLIVVAKPSNDATVEGSTLAPPPAFSGVQLEYLNLGDIGARLFDPNEHHLILASDLPLSSPEQLVLNVNETGVWTFSIRSNDYGVTNYTVSVSVVPAPIVQEVPAGAACGDANAPFLDNQGVQSSLSGNEARQVYRFHTDIGDDFAATLVMPDAVGQDFDLTLYAPNCAFVQSSTLGKRLIWDGDVPKGVSDVVFQLPVVASGDYWIEVSRIVGQGSYQLTPTTASPLPTVPMNDALTGADASNDANAPTPLPLDRGVFEGRFADGDSVDAYSFPIGAGERVEVTYFPSPANTGSISVSGAGLTSNRDVDSLGHGQTTLTNPSTSAGLVTIVVSRGTGGGNYAFSVIHA